MTHIQADKRPKSEVPRKLPSGTKKGNVYQTVVYSTKVIPTFLRVIHWTVDFLPPVGQDFFNGVSAGVQVGPQSEHRVRHRTLL